MDVVAVYRSNRIDPTQYGESLFYLGRLFNHALLAVESNSIGVATLAKLKQMNYPNLYYQTNIQKLDDEEGERPGFKTTSSTKPAIIGRLQNAIKNRDLKINDEVLLQELKEFIQFEGGKTGAMPGCHDDHVIAAAIAVEVHRSHGHRLTTTRQGYGHVATVLEDNSVWL